LIKSGSIGVDRALGGGWPTGAMNEIWGEPGSGKTVLAKHTAENAVRLGMHVLWIDLAAAVEYMDDAPMVIVGRPRNAEDAFLMAMEACRYPSIDLVVFDPAQQLVRQRELDGDPEYVPHPQREYRLELNDLKTAAQTHGTTVLFVSRPRDTERQPVRGTGISEKALYRVHLHPDVVHQDGTREVDAHVKNVPDRSTQHNAARFTVIPGKGIDQARELVEAGIGCGVIRKQGSWLEYRGRFPIRCQGVTEMARLLRTRRNSTPLADLEQQIRSAWSLGVAPARDELVPS
jgi:recombination protein RecA